MAARHRYRNDDGDLEDVPNVTRMAWVTGEKSEEGDSASLQVSIPDPDMSLNFVAHRRWIVYEDDSEDDNTVIFSGFVADQEIGRQGGEFDEPLGRVWTLTLTDMNTLWNNRVMTGSDCKRPEETDVERMQWLVDTEEMGYFSDLTLLAAGSPETLDKRDTRGQSPKQIADECAQQTGKNYWIGATNDGIFLWYGKDSLSTYSSPLSLSNDPTDLVEADLKDGTSLVWPLSHDTKLRRTGERIYSGAYVEYEKGAVYRTNSDTFDNFTLSGRDIAHPAPEIKTKARAVRRALRLLDDFDEQEEIITTTVEVPDGKATMIRTGMRISITATHLPGFETGRMCRILSAQHEPKAAGERYSITIEATPIGGTVASSCSTVISAAQVAVDEGTFSTSPSVGITVPGDAVLIAWLIGNNGNTPPATDMAAISGYTALANANHSRSTYRIGTKTITGGGSSTASSTFTSGFGTNDVWVALQVALGMSSATPVQVKQAGPTFFSDLDSTPTPGNIVLVFALADSGATALGPNADVGNGPTTGWTELVQEQVSAGNSNFRCAIFARCVQTGETGRYGYSVSNGYTTGRCIYIAEFAP